ncbi:flagellar hook-associated protein FlgK [Angustibacter aerolatus]
MSSTFGGITTALNSLMAQRRALDVAGQNIANAGTVGYTRQRANLQAITASGHGGLYAGQISEPGFGVDVRSVDRLADALTDSRQRDAHSTSSFAAARASAYTHIESIVNEPSDTGVASQLADFWSSWQAVANAPGGDTAGSAARTQLLSQATTLVGSIKSARSDVQDSFVAARGDLNKVVSQVNSTAKSIADLNDRIRIAKVNDGQANELTDQRDQLVLQLSELVGATSRVREDGTADVSVGGSTLVSSGRVTQLSVSGAGVLGDVATSPVQLTWADGSAAQVSGGQAGGMLSSLNSTYPKAAAGYDAVAAGLISSVNALHSTGKDLDGTTGVDFFSGTDATDIAVAITSSRGVAAAASTDGALGGTLADRISALANSSGGPDAAWASYVSQLGVESQAAGRAQTVQTTVLTAADAARSSVSGVSIDEEMTNMLMYQRAYEGAAKVMSAVDEMLQTLMSIGR